MEQGVGESQLLLKDREAARMLAISPRTLWTLMNSGEIRCIRIGRLVRYRPDDLKAFIEKRKEARH